MIVQQDVLRFDNLDAGITICIELEDVVCCFSAVFREEPVEVVAPPPR